MAGLARAGPNGGPYGGRNGGPHMQHAYGQQQHPPPPPGVSPQPSGPPGSLPPGTIVKVGPYTVTVKRYLSQGGFATVYLGTTDRPVPIPSPDGTTRNETMHVLKRIVVPDKDTLAEVKREVEVHRMLRHDPAVVFFLEASALALPPPQQGYEVYILMEYCNGGGLLDLLNARLRSRLTEPEVLRIFADVCKGVAAMHHLDPPIAHRDLKIENILLAGKGGATTTTYKLCDFGSAKPILSRRPPRSMDELKRLEMDLNKSTTLPYRPPEMVDVYQRRVIDEKADIWALGVLLYKLCYYTTPFEENGGGPLAILNVKYRFPSSPPYSDRIKGLIASLLVDPSTRRPSIDDLLLNVHRLMGVAPPKTALHYSQLAREGKQMQALPTVQHSSSSSASGGRTATTHRAVDDDVLVKIAQSRNNPSTASRPMSMAISNGSASSDAARASPLPSSSSSHDLVSFQDKRPTTPTAAESKRIMDMEGVKPMRRGRPGTGGGTAKTAASASSSSSPARANIGKLDLSKFESGGGGGGGGAAGSGGSTGRAPGSTPASRQTAPPSAPRVGTLVEGFGDSFEPTAAGDQRTPPTPPVAGTTNQGALAVPPANASSTSTSPSPSPADATPIRASPALPGLGSMASGGAAAAAAAASSSPEVTPLPPPATSSSSSSSAAAAAAGDTSAEGRFPSLEELDKRYPQLSTKSSAAGPPAHARKPLNPSAWNARRDRNGPVPAASSPSSSNLGRSTSQSQARYDEARKTLGKRESLANIAGKFGGMAGSGGGSGGEAASSSPPPPLPTKRTPAVAASDDAGRRPTPNLPPRKPVPRDWLEPSSEATSRSNTGKDSDNATSTGTKPVYKSPARYGGSGTSSKATSPAEEKRVEDIVVAAPSRGEEPIAGDQDGGSDSDDEGPEDVNANSKRFAAASAVGDRDGVAAVQRPPRDEDYATERPTAPVATHAPGKLRAPEWLSNGTRAQKDADGEQKVSSSETVAKQTGDAPKQTSSHIETAPTFAPTAPTQVKSSSPPPSTTTAQLRAPAWEWDAEEEAEMRALPEPTESGAGAERPLNKLVDLDDVPSARAEQTPSATNLLEEVSSESTPGPASASASAPPAKQASISSMDSATKGLPSRQRIELGKVYADAATSPGRLTPADEEQADETASPVAAPSASTTTNEPKRYAPGTAHSMASRWESMSSNSSSGAGGGAAQPPSRLQRPRSERNLSCSGTGTRVASPPAIPAGKPTMTLNPQPSSTARPRPHVPAKPTSLKPWEREAAERAEVEKYGHLRTNRAVEDNSGDEEGSPLPTLSTSSTGAGETASQQQRYQSVASLIDKWQASSKSAKQPSGWGEIGNGGLAKERLPGRDV